MPSALDSQHLLHNVYKVLLIKPGWLVKASNSSLVSCLTPPGATNLCLFLEVISLISFRYAGFLALSLLAMPKPNPTCSSGKSSRGITVEDTGTITLSAVFSSLSNLYMVGPAMARGTRRQMMEILVSMVMTLVTYLVLEILPC